MLPRSASCHKQFHADPGGTAGLNHAPSPAPRVDEHVAPAELRHERRRCAEGVPASQQPLKPLRGTGWRTSVVTASGNHVRRSAGDE
jgi:hypothetical protein